MKTISAKAGDITRKWVVIDASGKILGRIATTIAHILKGKHKPIYTPHVDTGDFVVVINADKIRVTGKKPTDKMYRNYSGYPGGLKEESFQKLMGRFPERIIEIAVKGMLPKNPLGRQMFRKLKVYSGAAHPHEAQQPELMNVVED
jgi:large subunit ribosomal protein L13